MKPNQSYESSQSEKTIAKDGGSEKQQKFTWILLNSCKRVADTLELFTVH